MTTLHIVSHTHWDREWYQTFQEFRFRLVHTMDALLALLEQDPGYAHFTLDGQTIVLDDYLAIRPEQESRIRRLVQEGRLLVGPWYVLPDEFLEGPEALIRNLLFGSRGCRRFTDQQQPMERICYIPDPFGHLSQLPQIAAGFGMDALCFWRGVGDVPTEFRWASPDGTERLVLHLRDSYSNGAWLRADEEGFVRDLVAECDALSPHATSTHLLIMQGTDHMAVRPDLPERMRAAEARLGKRIVHSTLPAYLEAVKAELGDGAGGAYEEQHLVRALPLHHGEMRSPQRSHLLPAVLSARMWIKQTNARCETLLTRWAEPFSALAGEVGCATSYVGFLREAWGLLLQNHPHDSICGCSVDQVHREMSTRFAWSEQIAEQVTRASLDAIAGQISTELAAGGSQGEAAIAVFNPLPFARTDRVRVHLSQPPQGKSLLITECQPEGKTVPYRLVDRSAHEREHYNETMSRQAFAEWLAGLAGGGNPDMSRVTIRQLDVHVEEGIAHLEAVIGANQPGAEATAAALAAERLAALLADDSVVAFHVHVVEDTGLDVEFAAHDVPSMGYAQYALSFRDEAPPPQSDPRPPSSISDFGSGSEDAATATIENEYFVVTANPTDGTITVTDKATSLVLAGVNRFVDGGDRGDEYTYCPPQNDSIVSGPAAPPAIRRLDDEVGNSLEVGLVYRLPLELAEDDRSSRSSETVDMRITTRVTLTPGVRRVEFQTTVINHARDHRLRVHFPTPIRADRSWAESHFDVVERPVDLPADTAGWSEQPVATHPQLTFSDVSDGHLGVMLLNRGLPEYEVVPASAASLPLTGSQPAGKTSLSGLDLGATLVLTLLRCVGWLSRGDLTNRVGHAGPALPTPEAQCLGQHTFHYALVPHAGNYLTAFREAHAFNAALRAVCTGAHAGTLSPEGSFLEILPSAVVLDALKVPEHGGGLVVRAHNCASVPVRARLAPWRPYSEAYLVPLSEGAPVRPLTIDSGVVVLPLRAKEIATVRLT